MYNNFLFSYKKGFNKNMFITRYIYIVFVLQFLFFIAQQVLFIQYRPLYGFIGDLSLSIGFLIYFISNKIGMTTSVKIILFWSLYMFLLLIIGFFLAKESAQRVILLDSLPSFFLPLSFVFFQNLVNSRKFFIIIRKLVIPIFTLLAIYDIYNNNNLITFETYLLHFFVLLIFIWNWKTALLIIVFVAIEYFMTLNSDSRAMNLSLISLISIAIISKLIGKNARKYFKYLLLLPIFFTILAMSGISNILKVNTKNSGGEDTRSKLYEEVYIHLKKNNAILWGTTPGIGYRSSLIDLNNDNINLPDFWKTWHNGRLSTEAGIVNVFLWGGVINIVFFFLIFWTVVEFASKYANNSLAYGLILFICFRWAFSFIDGVFTYSYQYLTLWIAIGLCLNINFLRLSDKKIKIFFK